MHCRPVIALALLLALPATSARATDTVFTDSSTVSIGTPPVALKPSTNVTVKYSPGADKVDTTGVISYSVGSSHGAGTKTFASSSGDTKIYVNDTTLADPPPAPATAGGTAQFSNGWSIM